MKTKTTAIPMIAVFLLALIAAGFTAKADPRFIGIDEIRPGMRGKALTVLEGTKIESFGVEILGLTAGTGRVGSLILIRTYGSALREFGGIASGMSGSPVFIGNRLLGAISYTFANADPSYGLVTPIADMLALWDYKDAEDQVAVAELTGDLFVSIAGQSYRAIPVTAPVYLSGFGQRTGSAIKRFLGELGVSAATSSTMPVLPVLNPSDETIASLEPGSPLGLQLITGDLGVSSIGTLTWIDNGRFVAFGHPVLSKGDVALLATGAKVFRTISSSTVPSKLAINTRPVGIITQDRSAGLAGRFGKLPAMLPVVVQVTDQNTGNEVVLKTSVVLDSDLTPTLASMAVIEALDRALDRVGAGSAKIDLEVLTAGSRADLHRQNLFYHQADVASVAIMDLLGYLNFLLRNNFEEVRPLAVNVSAVVSKDNLSAIIADAHVAQDTVRPGATVDLIVQLRPYRGSLSEITIPVKIPEDIAPGRLDFFVSGGALWAENESEEDGVLGSGAVNFAEAHQEWIARPANMHIVVRYAPDLISEAKDKDEGTNLEDAQTDEEAGSTAAADDDAGEAAADDDAASAATASATAAAADAATNPTTDEACLLTVTSWFVQGSKLVSIEVVDPAVDPAGE